MTKVPWWGVASSVAAPVLLIGGWTWAASRQQPAFDSVTGTISALAARGADDRWLMTGALLGVGACHMVTAAALRPARRPGRWVLAFGGVATAAVALAPLPADGSRAPAHAAAAAIAFLSLAAWPAFSDQPGSVVAWALRPLVTRLVSALLLAAVAWFFVAMVTDASNVGLAERVAAGAQSIWPVVVVLSAISATDRQRAAASV